MSSRTSEHVLGQARNNATGRGLRNIGTVDSAKPSTSLVGVTARSG
jgi:hypothetical protein